MKKYLIMICLVAGVAFSAAAQHLKFYYYPSKNVYYDPVHKQYIYSDNGNWTTVTALPANVTVVRQPRVTVYSNSPEVWHENAVHVKKYKDKTPNGKAVGYKGTNPNKAKGKMKKSGQ